MNGRFINDIVEFKCKDGKKRDAMIIKDSNDGRFEVAYIDSDGCKNVQVHVETDVKASRLTGHSVHKETILPYQVGDLVAYYIEPEIYYLAHIIEIGSYNTVKLLLGDLYMNGWVKDNKKNDTVVADVKDIRWDGHGADFDKKTKIKYGYEPQELRDPNWGRKLAKNAMSMAVLWGFITLAVFIGPKAVSWLENASNQSTAQDIGNIPQLPAASLPSEEVLNSYTPLQRVFSEIYRKPIEDITEEEKAAVTYLKIDESDRFGGESFVYFIEYSINENEKEHFSFDSAQSFDSYNFPEFSGVSELVLETEDLKTLEFISSMSQIKKLTVQNTGISDISVLKDTQIESLTIKNNDELKNYAVLSKMPKLKDLYLDCDVEDVATIKGSMKALETLKTDNLSVLKKCPNIKKLELSFFFQASIAKNYSEIVKHDSLEEVIITNGNIDESAIGLFKMKNLKSLTLTECQLRINPKLIPDNKKLTSLSVSNIVFIDNYKEQSDGFVYYVDYDKVELCDNMSFFKHFPNLKKLSITNQKIEDISILTKLKKLETIDLSSNYITDYTPLDKLPNLEKVIITDNPFNEDPANIEIGDGVQVIY